MATMTRSARGARVAAKVLGRTVWGLLRRKRLVSLGAGLMARLLLAAKQHGVEIWCDAAATDLIVTGGRVTGVAAEYRGRPVRVHARHGVLLVAGGYARNAALRKEFRDPASERWTLVIPEDTGDMIIAAQRQGAATDLMDEAIWTPVSITPEGAPVAHLWERWLPHAIIVDSTGARYCNESTSYMAVGQAMYQRNQVAPAIPSWLVIDAVHRRRYPFGGALPGITPKKWITSGYLKKAGTLEELADRCGIDRTGLRATVGRFNVMAAAGKDEDFGRGESRFDHYFHDPTVTPCAVLGPISTPPFYAVAIYPGDVSTYGGLVTDEHARVLRPDGSPIDGLYAAGSTAASVCGHTYPGAGIAVGGSATFGYLAVRHMARAAGEPVRGATR
jgi:3-oxosteroid 1-dehydrogenase